MADIKIDFAVWATVRDQVRLSEQDLDGAERFPGNGEGNDRLLSLAGSRAGQSGQNVMAQCQELVSSLGQGIDAAMSAFKEADR